METNQIDKIQIAKELYKEKFFIPEEISYTIHFYNSHEALYNDRLKLTENDLAKKVLIEKKSKFYNADGCFVIPTLEKHKYDILLINEKDGDLYVYDFLHELAHIVNYHISCANSDDNKWLSLYTNSCYNNWDEFCARYCSTLIYLKDIMKVPCIIEVQNDFLNLADMFYKRIPEEEFKSDFSMDDLMYDLMQYLGFIAAVEDGWNDIFIMPRFICDSPELLSLYKNFKDNLDIIRKR